MISKTIGKLDSGILFTTYIFMCIVVLSAILVPLFESSLPKTATLAEAALLINIAGILIVMAGISMSKLKMQRESEEYKKKKIAEANEANGEVVFSERLYGWNETEENYTGVIVTYINKDGCKREVKKAWE